MYNISMSNSFHCSNAILDYWSTAVKSIDQYWWSYLHWRKNHKMFLMISWFCTKCTENRKKIGILWIWNTCFSVIKELNLLHHCPFSAMGTFHHTFLEISKCFIPWRNVSLVLIVIKWSIKENNYMYICMVSRPL